MKVCVSYSDGGRRKYENGTDALEAIRRRSPDMVAYDASGWEVGYRTIDKALSEGRVLVWETVEDSVGDDGSHTIAEIRYEED